MLNTSFFQIIILILFIFLLFGDFNRLKKNILELTKKFLKKQEE